jgi:2'-5' RNA ligase
LYDKLAVAFEGLGFRQEQRAFKAHITLGRVKFAPNPEGFRGSVEQWGQMNFGLQHADELVVFSSHLSADGPVYTVVARAPLGG